MALNPDTLVRLAWEALGVFWLIGIVYSSRRVIRRQPAVSRLLEVVLGVTGFVLVTGIWFQIPALQQPFLTRNVPDLQWAGVAITLAGCLFAAWARIVLGLNWSGRPSVLAGHELITRGPYALARHPIYTGILVAAAGTALVIDRWRALAGLAFILLTLWLKIRQEEQFMMETFPESYPPYRRQVKALIPGVL